MVNRGKENRSSTRAAKARLSKEIKECEREMEGAFKLQLNAERGSMSEKFVLEKLEALGKKKAVLEAALSELAAADLNVISLEEARQDLENRVSKVARGWVKLPGVHRRRALRRLIQKLYIGPKGMDVYHFTCASLPEGNSGDAAGEAGRASKGLSFQDQGTRRKSLVGNCLSGEMEPMTGVEPATYALRKRRCTRPNN